MFCFLEIRNGLRALEEILYREFEITKDERTVYDTMEKSFQRYTKGDLISVGEVLNDNFA